MDEWLYDAFISYSHRDLKWGKWLQRKLETYPLPAEIRKARGDQGKHLRIFRDQTDLAGVELQESLQRSLRNARTLIVICSPGSAGSKWVGDEIRYFKSLGRADSIIPFVVEGEPESDHPELECYHEELRNLPDKHFLGANIKEIGRNKAFLRLTAILLDVRFDRLVNREKQRTRRTALIFGTSAAVILSVVSILLWNNFRISRENRLMSYDIYSAALLAMSQKEQYEPSDIEFLKVSAEAGNVRAMFYLGDCYKEGKGVSQDPEAAFNWYLKAAEAGNLLSMVAVANCYGNEIGVEQDPEKMFEWNYRAAESGSAEGMLNVGLCYQSGTGVEADPGKGFEYILKAAETGYDLGMYNAALCYLLGTGTEVNPEQVFYWTHHLAETGNTEGMYNLAMLYEYGIGTEENPEQAYEWYRRAADTGDARAMYMTGVCIENHYGVQNAALDWYRRAAELGSSEAMEAAERLQAELGGEPAGDPGLTGTN